MDQALMEELRKKGLEAFGLFYGHYPASVVDNADPEGKGRLRVRCEQVLGKQAVWARPAFALAGGKSGFLAFPDVGDGVWLVFQQGRPESPIWSGGWPGAGELADGAGPGVHVWRTKGGQEVRLHEADDKVTVATAGGATLELDGAADKATVQTAGGGSVVLEGKVATVTADTVNLGAGGLTALDGVVTKQCNCAYTGGPHPVASAKVLAEKGGV